MRLKDYDEKSGKRVWLSEREIGLLLEQFRDRNQEQIAAILMARCGLRRQEVVDVQPAHLVATDHGQVVRVWHGKGDKYREVPAPDSLTQLALGMGNDPDEPFVSMADSTLYDWVQRAAGQARAETGDRGWQFVGPHDLRRSWGVRLLEAGVLPSVVMEWGGWEDWETFRNHYLAEFSPEALRRERGKVGWLGGEEKSEVTSYAAVPSSGRQPPQ
jgi:integrase